MLTISHSEIRKLVIQLRTENPDITYTEAAFQYILRHCKHVRLMLKEAGLPGFLITHKCKREGCSRQVHPRRTYCSTECYQPMPHVTVTCDECGGQKEMQGAQYRRAMKDPRYKGHFFCSRQCQGRWWNKNHIGGRKLKDYCHRGHLMAETRARTPRGVTYCRECSRINDRIDYAEKRNI